jgi:type II secretory pathway pseudopilin PulG
MRRSFLPLILAALGCVSGTALAQSSPASDARRAAQAAREAAAAAELAAKAARDAAEAAARAAGEMPETTGSGATLPAEQNLSVDERKSAKAKISAERTQASIAQGVANGPNGRALKSTSTPDLQLLATSKDKIASLAWTFDVSGSPRPGKLTATQLTATATTALDSEGEAEILGLKGFPGGTELSLNLIHYIAGFAADGTERTEVAEARSRCRAHPDNAGKPDIDTLCNPYEFKNGVSRFVEKYYKEGLRPMLRGVMPGSIYFVGGELTANQTDFDYLDQAAFAMQSKSRFGYSGTVFGGLILPSGQTSFTASFTYGRKYKAADPITLCQAINAVPQTQCITAPGAAPARRSQAIVSLEARHAFPANVGEFARFAIAPEVSFDLESDAYSLDLPVYLMGDGSGKLRGGVRFGYLNSKQADGGREGDFSLGMFVGVPFSVFH